MLLFALTVGPITEYWKASSYYKIDPRIDSQNIFALTECSNFQPDQLSPSSISRPTWKPRQRNSDLA